LKRILLAISALLLLLILQGCVTRKKRADLSLLGKIYENTTARYNGYFNANEILEINQMALSTQDPVNYQKELPIYPYLTASNRKAAGQEMDKAIKKVTRVVALHPRSHWIDDCYLLAGQAWFIKEDYENAEKAFRYLIAEFDPQEEAERKADKAAVAQRKKAPSAREKAKLREKAKKAALKKRKKYNREVRKRKEENARRRKQGKSLLPSRPEAPKKESEAEKAKREEAEKRKAAAAAARKEEKASRPEQYFLRHRPVFQEGKLWLAKTLLERDNDDSALLILEKLTEDETTFPHVLEEAYPLLAYYQLKRKQEVEAAATLEKSVTILSDRQEKARLSFLSGQLHARNKREAEALSAFQQAEKWAPDYEMAFNSRLNKAQLSWLAGQGSYENALTELDRLAEDSKNLDYLDQLFYSKGQMALKNNRETEAIGYFKESIVRNTVNTLQKTESAYILGSLFFSKGEFLPAKNYLDTTLQTMAVEDPRRKETLKLRDNLTDIAALIETIALQDSLIRIGRMSPEERMALAQQVQREEDRRRMEEIEKRNQASLGPLPVTLQDRDISGLGNRGTGTTSFFAYDDQLLRRGIREFERIWGSRTLQDNWRQGGQKLAFDFPQPLAQTDTVTAPERRSRNAKMTDLTQEDITRLLGDYPQNQAAEKVAQLKIIESLFKLGTLYREKLNNLPKSIEAFSDLDKRFPGTNIEVNVWYYLYLNYRENEQVTKAERFRSQILDKYGSTYFAQAINDPDFVISAKLREREINQFYDQAYQAFTARRYEEALSLVNMAPEKTGSITTLNARFALLGAMCTGSLKGKEAYIFALQEVMAKFPDTDEQRRAAEILRLLGEAQASMPGQRADESGQFQVETDQVHYIIFVFPGQVDLNPIKVSLSDFNRKYFSLEKLNMTNLFLGEEEQSRKALLILRRFNNQGTALNYYLMAEKYKQELNLGQTPYDLFIIGLNNYRELLRVKDTDSYFNFFRKNILGN